MFRFAPYVWKNLWRHRTRSALTISGSAVAVFVFCWVAAVQEGLDRLTKGGQADRTLVVFQENRFCPSSSHLPQDYARSIADIEGVADVVPVQVYTNNCHASLDVVVFKAVPPEKLRSSRRLQLTTGNWEDYLQRQDAAVVGAGLARRRNLSVGKSFTIGNVTVQVAGVFRSSVAAEEDMIYTHLDFLQQTCGSVGEVTQIEVQLTEEADVDAVAATIDQVLRAGSVATATRRKSVFQAGTLGDLVDLVSFSHWLAYACVGLVLSLVATTTVMAVHDRRGQYAVLQTLGVRPAHISRLIIAESMAVCLAGGMVGTGLALAALSWSGCTFGAEGVIVAIRPSLHLGGAGLLVSTLVGGIAGLAPAWQAARTSIVGALR